MRRLLLFLFLALSICVAHSLTNPQDGKISFFSRMKPTCLMKCVFDKKMQLRCFDRWRISGAGRRGAGEDPTILALLGKELRVTTPGSPRCKPSHIISPILVSYFCRTNIFQLCRGLSTMGLTGTMSGDIGGLSDLISLWVLLYISRFESTPTLFT